MSRTSWANTGGRGGAETDGKREAAYGPHPVPARGRTSVLAAPTPPLPRNFVPPLRFRPGRPAAPGRGQKWSRRPFPGTRGEGRSRCQGTAMAGFPLNQLFPFLSFSLLCSFLCLLRFSVSIFSLPLSCFGVSGVPAAPLGSPRRPPSPGAPPSPPRPSISNSGRGPPAPGLAAPAWPPGPRPAPAAGCRPAPLPPPLPRPGPRALPLGRTAPLPAQAGAAR